MRWVGVAWLIAGCGRVSFDPLVDGNASGDGTANLCGPWGAPVEMIGLTTVANDWGPTLRADGLELFWHTQRGGGPGEADFWSATRPSKTAVFTGGAPVPGINSPLSDENCTLSQDGLTIYLSSLRDGPYHLYRATRPTTSLDFSTPIYVSELSTLDLRGPALAPAGDELLFSNGTSNAIDRAAFNGSTFEYRGEVTELSLGPQTQHPSFSAGGLTLVYAAVRGTDGQPDVYTASRPTLTSPFANETRIDAVSLPGIRETDPEISADGKTLYFASQRAGGTGQSDLYMATRDCP